MSMDPGASPPLSMRDQAMHALRAGDLDKAIDLLTRVVISNDSDADAKALLGIAFSSKGLHAQAKRAIQTAVELQPNNANFRLNLGIVLKRAGDLPGAAQAFRETLQVSPDHAQAKAELTALGPQAAPVAPPRPQPPGAPTYGTPPPSGPSTYGAAPPPPAHGAPPQAPPLVFGAPPPGAAPSPYGAPPSGSAHSTASPLSAPLPPPPIGNPAAVPPALVAAPPAPVAPEPFSSPPPGAVGQVQCANCGQFPPPGMLCAFCSHPLPPPPRQAAEPTTMAPAPAYGIALDDLPPDMSNGEGFFRRAGATIIDTLVMSAMLGVGMAIMGGPENADPTFTFLIFGVLLVGYMGGMTAAGGQTLGKMALGIRVVSAEGGNPGFFSAAFRELIGKQIISPCVFYLGYLWCLWDGDQQCWHDKLFGTTVVRT